MKSMTKLLLVSAIMAGTSAAYAFDTPCLQGAQLNPLMKAAFQNQGTIVSIYNHTYVVAKPANCYKLDATTQACTVGLLMPELHNAFNVTGPQGVTTTIVPLSDVVMSYTQSTIPGYLLNVTDVHKA